ncbi:MAG: carboxypeptidase-like regulatory domain-containing protein [Chloroflexota bacterium]|nr:carboxypeptidase-like regulatory domain-containing protein [Chloroflexota bacterium]
MKLVPDRDDAKPLVVDRDDLGDVLRAIGLEVVLPATRIAIEGTIYDSVGNPVPGAQVSAHSVDGKGLAFGTSDSDGTFTLEARQDAYVLGVRVEACERRWYHDTEGTTPSLEDAAVIDPAIESTTGIEIRLPERPADGGCPQ